MVSLVQLEKEEKTDNQESLEKEDYQAVMVSLDLAVMLGPKEDLVKEVPQDCLDLLVYPEREVSLDRLVGLPIEVNKEVLDPEVLMDNEDLVDDQERLDDLENLVKMVNQVHRVHQEREDQEDLQV